MIVSDCISKDNGVIHSVVKTVTVDNKDCQSCWILQYVSTISYSHT